MPKDRLALTSDFLKWRRSGIAFQPVRFVTLPRFEGKTVEAAHCALMCVSNPHLLKQAGGGDPAIDSVGFTGAVFVGFL